MDQHLGFMERVASGCLGAVKEHQLVLIQYKNHPHHHLPLWKEGQEVGMEWPERECSARRGRAQRAARGGAGSGSRSGSGEATLTGE